MGSGSSRAGAPRYPVSRAKMACMPARSGAQMVYLSARLREDGGAALDVFVDAAAPAAAAGTPSAVAAGALTAGVVQISGSGVSKAVAFAPAVGPGERAPGEPDDGPLCSHFTAPAPFVTRDSIVVVRLTLAGEELVFSNFIVALYAWQDC